MVLAFYLFKCLVGSIDTHFFEIIKKKYLHLYFNRLTNECSLLIHLESLVRAHMTYAITYDVILMTNIDVKRILFFWLNLDLVCPTPLPLHLSMPL